MNVTKKIHKLAIITITIIKKLNSPFEIFNSFDDSSIIFNSLLSFSVRVKNKKISKDYKYAYTALKNQIENNNVIYTKEKIFRLIK